MAQEKLANEAKGEEAKLGAEKYKAVARIEEQRRLKLMQEKRSQKPEIARIRIEAKKILDENFEKARLKLELERLQRKIYWRE